MKAHQTILAKFVSYDEFPVQIRSRIVAPGLDKVMAQVRLGTFRHQPRQQQVFLRYLAGPVRFWRRAAVLER